jgi:hypothetical protein
MPYRLAPLPGSRREIKDGINRHHVVALATLGGRCPCCRLTDVVGADGKKTAAGEFDHLYSASKPDIEHTWLICKSCHSDLTAGRIARDEREAEFQTYQNRGRRMTPGYAGAVGPFREGRPF